ncbi:MAG: hypothetical protein HY820_11425 [Acidobacteria bacterium]|nr:hypothetical protein [Acidobacteriota bacterium]
MVSQAVSRRSLLIAGAAAIAAPLRGQNIYTGKDDPLPRRIPLVAGPMTMVFEPELGFLRYLKFGDAEVIRGIYAAVRDENWGTVAPHVSQLKIETIEGAFQVSFEVECKQAGVDFFWRGEIIGETPGGGYVSSVRFSMEGTARSTFKRNRIGFCVLHPITECAGNGCSVVHTNGSVEKGSFPLLVSPHQPFKDMRSISHIVAPGLTADVQFEGEVFEMEDHRNWTDASYKTYCTPLEKPFPVEVAQGTGIKQSVTVRLRGTADTPARTFFISRKEVSIEADSNPPRPVPKIGLGIATSGGALIANEVRKLLLLKPAHLRLDWRFADGFAPLERAASEANALLCGVELAVHLTDDGERELPALARAIAQRKMKIARYLVLHVSEPATSARWLQLARQHLTGAPIGGGANAYFAELNRNRPDARALDFVTYSLNPQVHAFDNASLVENLAAQADAVNSARQFAGNKGIVISPVSLKPRFNPNATSAAKVNPAEMPAQVDPRQPSLLGAAWTLGSIKYLAESGVESATYYETRGPLGVMEGPGGSRWPKQFLSQPGQAFPLYHVIADVNEFAGGEVLPCRSSQPLAVEALMLRKGKNHRVLLANMTAEAQAVRLLYPGSVKRMAMRKLDEHTLRTAMDWADNWRIQPADRFTLTTSYVGVTLAPYGVASIDSIEGA